MGVAGGDLDTPPVRLWAGRGWEGLGRAVQGGGSDQMGSWEGPLPTGGHSSPQDSFSSEWPREPQVPLYVPTFHNGWEPPMDMLQEAPWEVEGQVSTTPEDEVRAPTAHLPPQLRHLPLHCGSPPLGPHHPA